ncbi:DUF4157 domain-containing protein [Streptomyces sp. HUCO-GS316]|nr:DUF4157 domain-containing protein [Streptomyces sp. HUCO-GS316]MXM66331.1 DUF4157 domain-containing protein [Streptomyces sp. HUCO-GS316]
MVARRARTAPAPEQPDTGVHEVLRSAGKPLAAPVRQEMESRFGTDFSGVRLHTGPAAARSARAIGARAYTSGNHVVVGDGGGDKHTLAHELTHVVQQRRGPVSGTDHGDGLQVSDPRDRFEREAEANAKRVMTGPAALHTAEESATDTERPVDAAPTAAAVQRAVTVGGAQVDDPARLVADSDLDWILSPTDQLVLRHLPRLGELNVKDGEELVIEVGRISSMIDLIHSINSSGILGRKTLSEQGTAYIGSNDRGDSTALAVNVLDARGAARPDVDIPEVVKQSLTMPNNGSFSVAMERPEDDDVILEEMTKNASDIQLTEAELAQIQEAAQGDESLIRLLTSAKKRQRLSDVHGDTVARNTSLLEQRTQNTAMAIIGQPGRDVVTLGPRLGSYESDVPSDQIPPGENGFTSLVLPAWFEPYAPLLMTRTWPDGVAVSFAGTKQITAHYRAKGTDWPVTVEAPDYAAEVEAQLKKFQVIATHILKISSL